MEYMKDYKGDALAITDEQVAADWRMGMLRGVARVMKFGAYPVASTGRFGATMPDTPRAHMYPGMGGTGEACQIAELYDLEEEGGKEYVFGTMGGTDYDIIILRGKATCACGRLVKEKVELNITPGELISQVMRAE